MACNGLVAPRFKPASIGGEVPLPVLRSVYIQMPSTHKEPPSLLSINAGGLLLSMISCAGILRFLVILTDGAGGRYGGRGRSRTHQTRSRASTALKAAHPTGSDTLPPPYYAACGCAARGFARD